MPVSPLKALLSSLGNILPLWRREWYLWRKQYEISRKHMVQVANLNQLRTAAAIYEEGLHSPPKVELWSQQIYNSSLIP